MITKCRCSLCFAVMHTTSHTENNETESCLVQTRWRIPAAQSSALRRNVQVICTMLGEIIHTTNREFHVYQPSGLLGSTALFPDLSLIQFISRCPERVYVRSWTSRFKLQFEQYQIRITGSHSLVCVNHCKCCNSEMISDVSWVWKATAISFLRCCRNWWTSSPVSPSMPNGSRFSRSRTSERCRISGPNSPTSTPPISPMCCWLKEPGRKWICSTPLKIWRSRRCSLSSLSCSHNFTWSFWFTEMSPKT